MKPKWSSELVAVVQTLAAGGQQLAPQLALGVWTGRKGTGSCWGLSSLEHLKQGPAFLSRTLPQGYRAAQKRAVLELSHPSPAPEPLAGCSARCCVCFPSPAALSPAGAAEPELPWCCAGAVRVALLSCAACSTLMKNKHRVWEPWQHRRLFGWHGARGIPSATCLQLCHAASSHPAHPAAGSHSRTGHLGLPL